MQHTRTPVYRLTTDCVWNSFRTSGKRHLLLTGSRNSGKTTLLLSLFPSPLPGITTWAEPGKAVYLKENQTGETAQVGRFEEALPGTENRMQPLPQGFLTLGIAALKRCAEGHSEWVSIDEIGYLESGCPAYCDAIRSLMEHKRLIAAVRKENLPFLSELRSRADVFQVDLDAPFGTMVCVIMASGLGQRFGGNKLMANFKGKPLLQWILDATEGIFARRVVVTRHQAVEALCQRQEIPVICHRLPYRSDTVRLGLQAIMQDVDGCLFCLGDQPLLRRDTVASLALSAAQEPDAIWRAAWESTAGSPVLFPKWAFPELLALPKGAGGGFVVKKHPERVRFLPVQSSGELLDVDRPADLERLQRQ